MQRLPGIYRPIRLNGKRDKRERKGSVTLVPRFGVTRLINCSTESHRRRDRLQSHLKEVKENGWWHGLYRWTIGKRDCLTVDPFLLDTSRSTLITTKRSLDLLTALITSSAERTDMSSTWRTTSPSFSPASSAVDPDSISKTVAPWLADFHSLSDSSVVGEQSGCVHVVKENDEE